MNIISRARSPTLASKRRAHASFSAEAGGQTKEKKMARKFASFSAAMVLFVPVAAALLMQAAQIFA